MKKKTYKSQSDFYKLGRDYSENHFDGELGDYLKQSIQEGIEFIVQVKYKEASIERLVYITGLPALLKQETSLVIDFLGELESVESVDFEKDRKDCYSVDVVSWNDFINEDFIKPSIRTHLKSQIKKVKKLYGLD